MAVLGLAGALAGCGWLRSPTATPPPPAPPSPAPRSSIIGLASWYGPGFNGKHTSSGEIYDQDDLTAACTTLPLGTMALVTNLQNSRKVEVRINDRGPFAKGRKIDLSRRAAAALGILDPGNRATLYRSARFPTPPTRSGWATAWASTSPTCGSIG